MHGNMKKETDRKTDTSKTSEDCVIAVRNNSFIDSK